MRNTKHKTVVRRGQATLREFITGEGEGELRAQSVRGSEDSGNNKFENPALKVKYFYQPKTEKWKMHLLEDW